jgi:hypothetical protein
MEMCVKLALSRGMGLNWISMLALTVAAAD